MDGSPRRSCGGGWGRQGWGLLCDSQNQARDPPASAVSVLAAGLSKLHIGLATKQPCCESPRKTTAHAAAVVSSITKKTSLCRSQSASIGGGAAPVRTTGKDQWGEVRNLCKPAKHTDNLAQHERQYVPECGCGAASQTGIVL